MKDGAADRTQNADAAQQHADRVGGKSKQVDALANIADQRV